MKPSWVPALLKQAPLAFPFLVKRTLEFRDVKELAKGDPALEPVPGAENLCCSLRFRVRELPGPCLDPVSDEEGTQKLFF